MLENLEIERIKKTDVPATVISVIPAAGAINVATNLQKIEVKFSESVELYSVLGALNCDNGLSLGTVSWDFQNNRLIYPVTAALSSTPTTYTCQISGILDYGKNASAPFTWQFTSIDANPPSVVSTSPANNATNVSRLTNSIAITFSKPMDLASLNGKLSFGDTSISVGMPTWDSSSNTATYPITNSPLPNPGNTSFSLKLLATVTDSSAGKNTLSGGDKAWTFKTGGPVINSVTPQNNLLNLDPANYTKTISFNYNSSISLVNPASQVQIITGGSQLSISSVTTAGTQLTITLVGTLLTNSTYVVFLDRSISDLDGTTGTADYRYYLSTGNYIDNQNGTVYAPTQNLYWMKCTQGMAWGGIGSNSCIGTASVLSFCNERDNDCNGGADANPLQKPYQNNGYSGIYESCNTLNSEPTGGYAGRTNWRVPSLTELQSLLSVSGSPRIDTANFPDTIAGRYWTSTSIAVDTAWRVVFSDGSTAPTGKDLTMNPVYTRCVSSGP